MLWKPESISGEITSRIPTETTRDRDLLGVSPAICELFRSFTKTVESKEYIDDYLVCSQNSGFRALEKIMKLLKFELDTPFDISTLSPEQLALIEEHTYGPRAEIREATLVGDGLQAFVLAGMVVHYHQTVEQDYYEFLSRLIDEVSISETIKMFESEWFVEFARDIARAPNAFYRAPDVGASLSDTGRNLQGHKEFLSYIEDDGNGAVRLNEAGKKYLNQTRHKHNKAVRTQTEKLLSGFRGTSTGCPVRHRRFGAKVLMGSAHTEDVQHWQTSGILTLSEDESSVVMDFDAFSEGAAFLARLLSRVRVSGDDVIV